VIRTRVIVVGLAAAGLLAGCSDVVDGTGALGGVGGPSGSSSSPDFPGQSGATSGSASASPIRPSASASGPTSTAVPPTPCPHVTYADAKLSFDCITTGFTERTNNGIWPLTEAKTVEASTGWVIEEGAGHWGSLNADTLSDIAKKVRTQMVDADGYGVGPKVDTVEDDNLTVDGAQAHLLHSTMTLDPAWVQAQQAKTAVKKEQLWIVAVKVGSDDVSLWYTSVPDLESELWAKVPTIIKSIKVG
jgi:hypothetical protein